LGVGRLAITMATFVTHSVIGCEHIRRRVVAEEALEALDNQRNRRVDSMDVVVVSNTRWHVSVQTGAPLPDRSIDRSMCSILLGVWPMRMASSVQTQEVQKEHDLWCVQSLFEMRIGFSIAKQLIDSFEYPLIQCPRICHHHHHHHYRAVKPANIIDIAHNLYLTVSLLQVPSAKSSNDESYVCECMCGTFVENMGKMSGLPQPQVSRL
jgi:hypothetical protein